MLEMAYNPTTTTALKFLDLLHNLVISCVKLVIEFLGVNGREDLWVKRNSQIRLEARVCGLAEVHV